MNHLVLYIYIINTWDDEISYLVRAYELKLRSIDQSI